MASVIQADTETVVAVHELVKGALPVKPGDTRPAWPGGTKPSSGSPKPSGNPDGASGGTQPAGGDAKKDPGTGVAAAGDGGAAKPEQPEQPEGEKQAEKPEASADSSKPSQSSDVRWGPSSKEENGKTYTAYEVKNSDGTTATGVQTEQADGTKTCKTTNKDGKEDDAGCPSGLTDEPNCTSGCERLAFLAALFCAGDGGGCGSTYDPLENNHDDPSKGARPGLPQGESTVGSIVIPNWAWSNPDHANAPKDYGNPNDPNAGEPVTLVDPRTDGILDPAEPGEGETETIATASIANDMRGTLRDPVAPPGTDVVAQPEGTPPHTGDAERDAVFTTTRP